VKVSEKGLALRHHDALLRWIASATAIADLDDVLTASIGGQLTARETMAAVRDITWRGAASCPEWKNIAHLRYVQETTCQSN
jgi:hypothetical protein